MLISVCNVDQHCKKLRLRVESGLAPGELKESCNGGSDHCIDDSYTGDIKLGPVEAGEVYTCGMVAFIDGYLDVLQLYEGSQVFSQQLEKM